MVSIILSRTSVCFSVILLLASTQVACAQVTSPRSLITGHRGASSEAPENTLAAFNNAVVPLAMLFSLFIFGEIDQIKSEQLVCLVIGGLLIVSAVLFATQSNRTIN